MGIPIGDIRPSTTIIYNNELYAVLSCEHTKIARGPAFCRARLRNLKNSQTLECTLRDSDNLKRAFVEKIKLQFLLETTCCPKDYCSLLKMKILTY